MPLFIIHQLFKTKMYSQGCVFNTCSGITQSRLEEISNDLIQECKICVEENFLSKHLKATLER